MANDDDDEVENFWITYVLVCVNDDTLLNKNWNWDWVSHQYEVAYRHTDTSNAINQTTTPYPSPPTDRPLPIKGKIHKTENTVSKKERKKEKKEDGTKNEQR